ncbi:MAG: helix-hairpin-helix domain-containing protein [Methylococcaceae bacterium]|jgi:competence protein ComEA|nr:helix-hairpin-helix domain-containing protein [Methylococcaceae bacterium]
MKKIILLLSLFAVNAIAAPVNINTADAKTISEALSGIGQKKAEAIVKYREEKGLFKTAEDLTNVAGIGEKTVEKNKNDILLSDAAATVVVEPKKDSKSK